MNGSIVWWLTTTENILVSWRPIVILSFTYHGTLALNCSCIYYSSLCIFISLSIFYRMDISCLFYISVVVSSTHSNSLFHSVLLHFQDYLRYDICVILSSSISSVMKIVYYECNMSVIVIFFRVSFFYFLYVFFSFFSGQYVVKIELSLFVWMVCTALLCSCSRWV